MKKTVSLILALLLICTTLFSLTACGGQAQDTDKAGAEATTPLTAQIEALEKKISSEEARIAELEAENATLKSEKASLTDENATLKAKVAELEAEIAELESENEELEVLVAALRNCLKGIHTYSGGICIYCEAEQGDVSYVRCDKDGTENAEGKYLLFGEYPQTIKADDVTITDTQDTRGYYLGSDGSFYAKVTATPYISAYISDYTFSTGSTVTRGSVYYFKVEPIRWRILSEENGEALILCDSIIANVAYQPDYYSSSGYYYTTANGAPEGTYANNYKYSNVRNWLNSTFYETAFSSLESSLILTTEVDNSAKSTNPYGDETLWNSGVNNYACENTSDKIFLLSEEEATNTNYRFASYVIASATRRMLTSDYSRATGARMSTSSSYYGNGVWWLRSSYYNNSSNARTINDDSIAFSHHSVYYTYEGVAPALRIRLEDAQPAYVRCDKDGTENAEGEYLLFGEYPQTIKADDVTITDTQDTRGYYLGSDGSYYAMVTASPWGSSYTFSTGSTVTSGSVYYFKVEPIRWRILSEENGEALILCDSIIANVAYQPDYTYDSSTGDYYTTANSAPEGTYANNYKYSNVRHWLNSTFFETAFSSLESSLILTTEVDNSAKSTNPYGNETCRNSGVNNYACENTSDKIFLLSEEEATNTNYGFASSETITSARMMLTSDYTRATGASMNTNTSYDYYGNGWWWLRSPYYNYSYSACGVFSDGCAIDFNTIYISREGVVPALRITL